VVAVAAETRMPVAALRSLSRQVRDNPAPLPPSQAPPNRYQHRQPLSHTCMAITGLFRVLADASSLIPWPPRQRLDYEIYPNSKYYLKLPHQASSSVGTISSFTSLSIHHRPRTKLNARKRQDF